MGELTLVGGLAGEHVVLRPVRSADVPVLLHIVNTPEVQQWWDPADLDEGWPLSNGSSPVRFTILVGRRIAGLIQYWEHDAPQNRHAGLELFLDPELHGRGLGRDAVRRLARHLFDDRGHHRLVIDTAVTNEIAIRCCAAVGFRPVGTMPVRERQTSAAPMPASNVNTRYGLVMDLLSTEFH